MHVFLADGDLFDLGLKSLDKELHAVLHDHLGSARPGGDQHRLDPFQPARLQFGHRVDEIRRLANLASNFLQPLAVGTVLASQHNHQIGLRGQVTDRLLAIGGGVADVFFGGANDGGKPLFESLDDTIRLGDAERGLGQVGQLRARGKRQLVDLFGRIDQHHAIGGFAHGANHLVVPFMPDEHNGVALLGEADRFEVHLGHQRAGGVDGAQLARLGQGPDGGRDPMRAVQQKGPLGNLVDGVHKGDPLPTEAIDHVLVVHNLVVDVDVRAADLDRFIEAQDGHVHPGTEPPRIGQQHLHDCTHFLKAQHPRRSKPHRSPVTARGIP